MLELACLKYAIIDPLINAHVRWNRNDDWNRLSIWTIQCQLCNHPSVLIRVVREGQLHLLLLLKYWSDVKLIPLSLVGILVCTLVPIEQDCILTWQLSINSQIYIYHVNACCHTNQLSRYGVCRNTYLERLYSLCQHARVTILIQLKA